MGAEFIVDAAKIAKTAVSSNLANTRAGAAAGFTDTPAEHRGIGKTFGEKAKNVAIAAIDDSLRGGNGDDGFLQHSEKCPDC